MIPRYPHLNKDRGMNRLRQLFFQDPDIPIEMAFTYAELKRAWKARDKDLSGLDLDALKTEYQWSKARLGTEKEGGKKNHLLTDYMTSIRRSADTVKFLEATS